MSDSIHTRIRKRRLALQLSMEALAEKVGLKSWQAIQQWENGETAPNRNRLGKVAVALETTKEYLLFGEDSSNHGNHSAVTEKIPALYIHPNRTIARIVSILEGITDVGLGEVLRAAKEAEKEHSRISAKPAKSSF